MGVDEYSYEVGYHAGMVAMARMVASVADAHDPINRKMLDLLTEHQKTVTALLRRITQGGGPNVGCTILTDSFPD